MDCSIRWNPPNIERSSSELVASSLHQGTTIIALQHRGCAKNRYRVVSLAADFDSAVNALRARPAPLSVAPFWSKAGTSRLASGAVGLARKCVRLSRKVSRLAREMTRLARPRPACRSLNPRRDPPAAAAARRSGPPVRRRARHGRCPRLRRPPAAGCAGAGSSCGCRRSPATSNRWS